jgi:hypothetical protein
LHEQPFHSKEQLFQRLIVRGYPQLLDHASELASPPGATVTIGTIELRLVYKIAQKRTEPSIRNEVERAPRSSTD